MVPVTPVLIEPWHALRVTGGSATVAASAFSGLEIAGTIGGVVGTVVALTTLAVTISANRRQIRREYDQEIQAAYDRGQASLRDDLNQARAEESYWRGVAVDLGGLARHHRPNRGDDEEAAE